MGLLTTRPSMWRYLNYHICFRYIDWIISYLKIQSMKSSINAVIDFIIENFQHICFNQSSRFTLERKMVLTSGLFLNAWRILVLSLWLDQKKKNTRLNNKIMKIFANILEKLQKPPSIHCPWNSQRKILEYKQNTNAMNKQCTIIKTIFEIINKCLEKEDLDDNVLIVGI